MPQNSVPTVRSATLAMCTPAATVARPSAVANTLAARLVCGLLERRRKLMTIPASMKTAMTVPPVSGARFPVVATTRDGTSER